MTDNEIIKALEICENYKETCEYCPYDNIRHCADEIRKDTLNLIKRQQKLLTTISDLIVENTYPGFDKEGKPVCIWNTDGYKKIENLLKAGDSPIGKGFGTIIDKQLLADTLDIVCRQQADIERLKKTNPLFEYAAKSVHQYIENGKIRYLEFVNEEFEAEAISRKIDYLCHIQDVRTETIKEFAEKLETNIGDEDFYIQDKLLLMSMIYKIVKEMAGENDA